MGAETKVANRWLIAIMGTVIQLCLGTVYAWSFFSKPDCQNVWVDECAGRLGL